MSEIVYTSESSLRNLPQFLRRTSRDLLTSGRLARRLLIRNITSEYRESVLGALWAFIPSLTTAGIFILLHHASIIRVGETSLPYAAYVLLSMTIWQSYIDSLRGPVDVLIKERTLISKHKVPVEAILLARVSETLFNLGVRLLVVLGILLGFHIQIQWTILLSPLALIALIALGNSLGLILAPLNVLYRDVSRGLTIVSNLWLFVTPVIYPVPKMGSFAFLVSLNPVTPLLVTMREMISSHHFTQLPKFYLVSGMSFFLLFFSWIILRASLPYIEERIH